MPRASPTPAADAGYGSQPAERAPVPGPGGAAAPEEPRADRSRPGLVFLDSVRLRAYPYAPSKQGGDEPASGFGAGSIEYKESGVS